MQLHNHVLRQSSMAPVLPVQTTSYPLACHQRRHRAPVAAQQATEAPTAGSGTHGYREEEAETYLGEKFWKSLPPSEDSALWLDDKAAAASPPLQLVSLNHAALGVQDVDVMIKFYTRVLGLKQLPRPPFPFGGAWLQGGGLTLHLIHDDPTIPRKADHTWKDQYDVDRPEPWYIRRGAHKAFAVASLEEAELRLKHYKLEYHKFLVPGTNAAQIFVFDPEGNGIELGEGYEDIAASLAGKEAGQ